MADDSYSADLAKAYGHVRKKLFEVCLNTKCTRPVNQKSAQPLDAESVTCSRI